MSNNNLGPGVTAILAGAPSFNQYSPTDSGPRGGMVGSHMPQSCLFSGIEERRILSGLDLCLGNTTKSIVMPENGKILAVISKFKKPRGASFESPKTILYITEDGVMDYIEADTYNSSHSEHGWMYTQEMEVSPGQTIAKGTVLYSSPSWVKEGGMKIGKGLITAYITDEASIEDGFRFNEDTISAMEYTSISTSVISINQGDVPINTYGDSPFPRMGEKIRPDGLVMAIRSKSKNPSMMSKRALHTLDPYGDLATYTSLIGGDVIDISIDRGTNSNITLTGISDCFDDLDDRSHRYYGEIYSVFEKHGSRVIGEMPVTHRLNSLLRRCLAVTSRRSTSGPKVSPVVRKEAISGYLIKITIAKTSSPATGFKQTCFHGGKGTSVLTSPACNMPVDSDGTVADVVVNCASTLGRMNLGRVHEHLANAVGEKIRRNAEKAFGVSRYDDESVIIKAVSNNQLAIDETHRDFMDFYEIMSPDQYKVFLDLTDNEIEDWIVYIIKVFFQFKFSIEDAKDMSVKNDAIFKRFRPTKGSVKMIGQNGKEEVVENVMLGHVHYMFLEKTPLTGSEISSARTQAHGIIAASSKTFKTQAPFRSNAVKALGEGETAVIVDVAGEEAISEIMDINGSVTSHAAICKAILESETPLGEESLLDRSKKPLGSTASLSLFKSHAAAAGYEYLYEKKDKQ